MSAVEPIYGVREPSSEHESPRSFAREVLPLLMLFVGLAIATMWFVALPALEPAPADDSCKRVIVKSGSGRCVAEPLVGSAQKPKLP
jgi:hypothetical protein